MTQRHEAGGVHMLLRFYQSLGIMPPERIGGTPFGAQLCLRRFLTGNHGSVWIMVWVLLYLDTANICSSILIVMRKWARFLSIIPFAGSWWLLLVAIFGWNATGAQGLSKLGRRACRHCRRWHSWWYTSRYTRSECTAKALCLKEVRKPNKFGSIMFGMMCASCVRYFWVGEFVGIYVGI